MAPIEDCIILGQVQIYGNIQENNKVKSCNTWSDR